jgi:hypothetical protein
MWITSALGLAAVYPHPATAHSLVPGMHVALLTLLRVNEGKLRFGHKSLTSYRLRYTASPPRSQIKQAAAQSARGLPLPRSCQ